MTLRARKLAVAGTVAVVLLLANCLYMARWLDRLGVVGWAQRVEATFLTGTAITILIALMLLVMPGSVPHHGRHRRSFECRVCHQRVDRRARYCGRGGSRVRSQRRCGRCLPRRVPRWG